MTYVSVDITVDSDQIAQQMYDTVATRITGWSPDSRSLDTAILEANARDASELRALAADVPDDIFDAIGVNFVNLPMIAAVAATVSVTFTLSTAVVGFTIPAGTQFALPGPDGILRGFHTNAAVTTSTTSATVAASADDAGSDANSAIGSGQLTSALANIDAVTASVASSGGVDAESPTGYRDRLARHLQTYGAHPILANDYAILAMDVMTSNGVTGRALGLDGYDAVGNTSNNPRVVTVVVEDALTGGTVPSGVKTAIDTTLQSLREINFDVRVVDPLYTNLTIVVNVTKTATADSTQVHDDVLAAVTAFINPATYGAAQLEGDPIWTSRPTITANDIVAAAGRVLGVSTVSSATINATSSVTMQSGKPHAMPQAVGSGSTITVNVT